jgi:glycine hydroxymethyltransferase
MKQQEMVDIAEFLKHALLSKESGTLREDIKQFRKNYQSVHYCFDSGDA